MRKYFLSRPMLLSGIICSVLAIAAFYSKVLTLFIGLAACLVIGLSVFKKRKNIIVLAVIFIMLISVLNNTSKIQGMQAMDGLDGRFQSVVYNVGYANDRFCLAEVEITKGEGLRKGTKLSVICEPARLSMGDIIEGDMKISSLSDEKYKESYYGKGIYLTASVTNITKLREKDFILSAVGKTRDYIRNAVFSNMGYKEASTFCALLFGDDSYFTEEFSNNVRRAGVSHVMVVSGMHLAIIVSLVLYLTNKIFYNRFFKALCIVAVVAVLTALCGFTMSMLRAGVTYLLFALALILNRDNTPENSLGAAVSFILIFTPFAIMSLSFQLSVLATFGIIVIALPLIEYFSEKGLIKGKLSTFFFSSVLTSLSATLLTLPIVIYNFKEISVVTILTNLLISNAVTAVLWIGVIALIINLVFSFVASIAFKACEIVIAYINFVIDKFGSLSFATVYMPKWTAFIVIGIILIIFYLLLACKVKRDMLKLKEMDDKISKEGGKVLKWR